jgi:multicomponent Na+:H+ antiporter subunit D
MISALRSHLPILPVITLLFAAYTLSICARRRYRLVELLVIGAEIVVLVGALYIARLVLWRDGSPIIYSAGGWTAPWGIELSVGGLAALSLLMIAVVGLFVALYASVNLEQQVGGRKRTAWFFTLYLLLCAALTGLAVTNDLFNVFVFVEVATISSCALVSARGDAKSTRAAFKYLILVTLGSGFVLSGIGLIYILTGNLNMTFASLELSHSWTEYPYVLWLAVSLFLVGFGVKSALFPLHVWLPDAHSTALTPASAILSGLAVKGYIIGLIKVLYVVLGPNILHSLGIPQILLGASSKNPMPAKPTPKVSPNATACIREYMSGNLKRPSVPMARNTKAAAKHTPAMICTISNHFLSFHLFKCVIACNLLLRTSH